MTQQLGEEMTGVGDARAFLDVLLYVVSNNQGNITQRAP